jgi:hypothetical protein
MMVVPTGGNETGSLLGCAATEWWAVGLADGVEPPLLALAEDPADEAAAVA